MPSFLFPLKGLYFFLTHPKELWLKTLGPVFLTLVFSVFSIGFSIKVLLPTQVEKLLEWHWPHWMSWFVSVISVVLESAILNLLFFAFLVGFFQDMIFDATIKAKGLGHLLDDTDDIPKLVLWWRGLRSSLLVNWVLIMVKILLIVVTAPLQLVPIAGTALACYISGWPTAWSQHLHYDMEIKGLKVGESYKYAAKNKWHYISFGSLAFGLELIPVFNIFFMWTNIVGAALWIADEYENEHSPQKSKDISSGEPSSSTDENTPLLSGDNA
ncbi:hypothetical protein INT47_013199 [Mucor saturninus]|uniref:Uncharacterized protein n=1 Tax=Mucor saturninus TaxID=64648 RepID=A0A8H7R2D2_9FUNG|nr:hypothetical protein INT47_013199 [Mucor saturninus]